MLISSQTFSRLELESAIVRDPLTVSIDAEVAEAVMLMSGMRRCNTPHSAERPPNDIHGEARLSCVIVIEDDRVVGILTDRDVVRLNAWPQPLDRLVMRQVMTHPIVTLYESTFTDPLFAMHLLQQYQIRHLPILDEQNHLVGLVTRESLQECLEVKKVQRLESRSVELEITKQLAIEAAIDGIAILQGDTYLYLNQAHLDLFGYECPEDLVGKTWKVLYASEEIERFEQEIFPLLARDRSWRGESIAIRKDGTRFHQGLSLTITEDRLLICVCRDISDRKQAELQLQQQARHKQLLWKITQTIRQSLEIEVILHAAVNEARHLLAIDRVVVYRFQPDWSGEFVTESVAADWVKLVGGDVKKAWKDPYLQETQGGRFQNHETVVVTDIYQAGLQPCHIALLEQFQARAYAITPIFVGESLWGLFAMYQNDGPYAWTTWQIELLQQIAGQLSIALHQANLYEQAQSELIVRQHTEAELQASRAFYQGIIADQTELICRFLPDGTLTFVNDAYCKFFQKSPEELLGHQFTSLLPNEDKDIPLQHFNGLSADNPVVTYEHRVIAPDGTIRWQQWTDRALFAPDGKFIEFQAVGRDITAMKEAEVQLRHTNEELARATRLKDEFLANMSHELRTPLNAILGMVEGLQEEVFGIINEQQLKALQMIERSSSHLLSLINDILDVAKIESGQMEIECNATSIHHLCQSSLTFVKQQALKKRIQIETKLPTNLPNVWVDERRIRQVLINLLTNAVKFTPKGGHITLEVSHQPHSLDPTSTDFPAQDCLHIAVTDTGIGIAPEHFHNLFQPFIQIDSALNRQNAGTGLGLALVKRIVEFHGGQVGLTSEVGVGSCFTIDLPCIASLPSASEPEAQRKSSLETRRFSQETPPVILLVEDNEANIITVSGYLQAKGYCLVLAKNGEEAIALAQSKNPDLILMDIQMPGMDGLEAMKVIRQDPNLVEVPIIALTALAMPGDREKCLEAGADDYLSKPVRLKQLSILIQQFLNVQSLVK